jgi:hypothetical protein
MTQVQKGALVMGYQMASAAVALAVYKNYGIPLEESMQLVILNVPVWDLVEEVDRWYNTHEGDTLLYTLIAFLGTGRSTNAQSQDPGKSKI